MRGALRVALTQTRNAYTDMPSSTAELERIADRLEQVRKANLEHNAALVRAAAERGAHVVGLGELFSAPYFAHEERPMWLELAEDVRTGPSVSLMREVARELAVVVVAPIYELGPDGQRFNTAAVIDERGELLGSYRKTHIPVGHNEKGSFHETFYYGPSDGRAWVNPEYNISDNPYFPVFRTARVRLGVAICYDRHFEGVMRSLALGGAQLVLCPAVSFGDKSERMWPLEFATDAMRHNLFIAGSNRFGVEPPWTVPYYGMSHVVGPNGACDNISDHNELVIADIDLDELDRGDPSGWNLSRDGRSDIYSRR